MAHGAIGLGLAWIGQKLGVPLDPWGMLIGSLFPDLDFFFLVPLVGRRRGHRTVTHSPVFHLTAGYLFRRCGFWSVFVRAIVHSVTDDVNAGNPAGIAWLWPLWGSRLQLLGAASRYRRPVAL